MSGDPILAEKLADAIREAGGVRYGDVDPERLADAILGGALAEALADVPAKSLGLVKNAATTHVRPVDSETGNWLFEQPLYRRRGGDTT